MKLLEPIQIGSMELRNRIVMPPMGTNFANENGVVTQRLIDYYVERAKGKVGFIIVEATCIESHLGKFGAHQLRIDGDKYLPEFADLVEAVHLHGAKIAVQLHHAGRQTTLEATEGRTPVSSSNVPYVDMYVSPGTIVARPKPLKVRQISELVEKFGEGARRAKSAGFDAIEIHGAHGYLIAQFLSPFANKRTDKYGGSFDGRLRFAVEVVECVRAKVGADYPISFRISADEFIKGGITLELAKKIAVRLQEAGIDVIHVSGSLAETEHMCEGSMSMERGYMVHLAEGIKKVVSIPVIAVGRINDPEFAEKILQDGRADLVAMGRALIADPMLPLKTMQGRISEVRKCIACNQGCAGRVIFSGLHMTCNINPGVGKEREYQITRAEKSRRVMIAGGGIAGMEAARVAALRGHDVTLFEKTDSLGGQFKLAKIPPHKKELSNILDYLRAQIDELRVEVELSKEVTPELVDQEKPEAVIVTTGANPIIPQIPGVESKHVITAWDLLAGKVDAKDESVILGVGETACETAEYLWELGKRAILVGGRRGGLALDMDPINRYMLLQRLGEKKIPTYVNVKFEAITNEGIIFLDSHGKRTLKAESIILALGSKPNNELARALTRTVSEVYAAGDCVEPRRSLEAIHEGSWAARQI